MRANRYFAICLVVGVVMTWPTVALAAEVEVFPLRVDLSEQQLRNVLNVVNNDDVAVTFQVETFLWTREGGVDRLTTTRDLLAVPPVFTVAPAATQAVRIGFRQRPRSDRETSYRLVFTELPDATAQDTMVAVVLRMSLPVFFNPATATVRGQWSARRSGQDAVELTLGNTGNVHMLVTGLEVHLESRPDEPLASAESARYVLPGSTEKWVLTLDRPLSGSTIIVRATTRRGELRETVAVSAP